MTISGPLVGGRHGRPFAAARRDIGAAVYLEEEYLLEGDAVPYDLPIGRARSDDGRWRVVEEQPRPFRTRVLVRRPFDPAHFNGCVMVVWIDVSPGHEVIGWETPESLNGCAWAFVSAQHVGVHGWRDVTGGGLVGWDPERYGTLHVDHDDLGYDIFTQAADAVGPFRAPPQRPGDVDPLGGLEVRHVFAVGTGQGACRVATYRNAVQPVSQMFDGFLLDRWFGTCAPFGDDALLQTRLDLADPATLAALDDRTRRGEHRLRTDLDVPTLLCNTESEAPAWAHVARPDDEHLRVWEVAGAAHRSVHEVREQQAKLERDLDAPPLDLVAGAHLSDFDARPARDAAIRTLCDWARTGEAPVSQTRLSIDPHTGEVERDLLGNAIGGVRLPQIEAPLASYRGTNDLPGPLRLRGSVEPFAEADRTARGPDAVRHVARVERAARAAFRAGVLLPRDRDRLVFAARAAAAG